MTIHQFENFIDHTWQSAYPMITDNAQDDIYLCSSLNQLATGMTQSAFSGADALPTNWQPGYEVYLFTDSATASEWPYTFEQCNVQSERQILDGPRTGSIAGASTFTYSWQSMQGPVVEVYAVYLNVVLNINVSCYEGHDCTSAFAPTAESFSDVVQNFVAAVDAAMQ